MNGESGRRPAAVSLRGLEKRFDEVVALHPLDLEVGPGEFVTLVGPSGCGKSTVLRLIAGLEDPSGGQVWIGGRPVADVEPADRDVAMVFQNYALYPHMTVRENLAFGLRMRRTPPAVVRERVGWAASVLGLGRLLDRRPGQLSGGEKQRVAFGRAMVREPQVFLFDEPLSNLDARLRADMRREIADLHARLGVTMIYVTHDQVEAMTLGQRIAVLRGGTLQQFATPLEVYRRPANLYVATFIGSPAINLAEGEVEHGGWRAGALSLAIADGGPGSRVPSRAVLGVRPEDLRLSQKLGSQKLGSELILRPQESGIGVGTDFEAGLTGKCFRPHFGPVDQENSSDPISVDPISVVGADFVSVVRRVEVLGNESLVHLDGPSGQPWTARVPPDWTGGAGARVGVALDRARLHLFDTAGPRLDVRIKGGAAP